VLRRVKRDTVTANSKQLEKKKKKKKEKKRKEKTKNGVIEQQSTTARDKHEGVIQQHSKT